MVHEYVVFGDRVENITERLPNTLILAGCAISFALILSIPLGVAAAIRPNSIIDRFALTLAVVGQALPSFWFALILIYFLGIQFRVLNARKGPAVRATRAQADRVLYRNAIREILSLRNTLS